MVLSVVIFLLSLIPGSVAVVFPDAVAVAFFDAVAVVFFDAVAEGFRVSLSNFFDENSVFLCLLFPFLCESFHAFFLFILQFPFSFESFFSSGTRLCILFEAILL